MDAAIGVLVGSRPHRRVPLGGAARCSRLEREDPAWAPGRRHRASSVRGRRGGGGPRARTSPAGSAAQARATAALVVFVGKLIVSKGVDLLLAAWPLVQGRASGGASWRSPATASTRTGLRRLLAALERGDLDDAREVARLGWGLEGGEREAAADPLRLPRRPARRLCRGGARRPPARSSSSAGSEHDEVAELLPRGRGAGDAEHLSGGLRDGRRRGRRLRGAAGLGRPLGDARGLAPARRGAAAGGRRG